MRRAIRVGLTVAGALLGLLSASLGRAPLAGATAGAGGGSVTAAERAVTATLTYPPPDTAIGPIAEPGLHLQIERSGQSFYSGPVSSPGCPQACGLETAAGGPLQVKDLEGNGQPEAIVSLNTGGAHCCTIVQVFSFDPGVQAYRPLERDFGDPGALLTDLNGDGHLEFESADDRFAYAFTSYAYSGLPLQVWRFQDGRFVDVTRDFPKELSVDAARQFKGFLATRRHGMGLGLIAAWAGDEYLLGHRALVARTLSREARAGHLRSGDHMSPGGSAFVVKLKRFLVRNGYA